ncbi:major facilitator superfamily domain-containing protein [Dissophora ornata]|nr:major facilitator superfamily domain-containing protein [Dissophora ornata]
MDPSLQEFYSLSRSTSHDRPLTQILPTSRSSSRLQQRDRPASANIYRWSQYRHPMSVPSIAQIYPQPNYQPGSAEGLPSVQSSSHRRHRTSDTNQGYFNPTAHTTILPNDDEPIPYDPLGTQVQGALPFNHTPQTFPQTMNPQAQKDPLTYSLEDENNPVDGFNRMEQLEDLDDCGIYSGNSESYNHNNNAEGPFAHSVDGDYGEENGGQDDTSVLLTPEKVTPLPKIPLFVLSVVIFSEPLTSTILFPFVYFMFCTSIFWGYMSDRYGRRPILLLGLCGSTVACIFFGLSKSLAWAITSRSMCGLLNGNVGVAKSMLGEIADHTNQSQAFSIFGFAWGIGMIVGPVLGGYLANPAKNFPDTFGNWTFFIEYPYFLPCFVAALGGVVGFAVGYFFLEETKGKNKNNLDEETFQGEDTYSNGYQNENHAYNVEEPSNSGNESRQPFKPSGPMTATTALTDIELERQPLMTPPNSSQLQQIKSANRRDIGHSIQYGSTMTLASETGENPSQFPNTRTSTSARSTLTKRPIPTRPSIIRHQRGASASGYLGESNIFFDRPASGARSSFYASRPMSSGGLFSLADPSSLTSQGMTTIPADAASLSLYGYTTDHFVDGRGHESGRRSRMSVAPSQVFVLPPDPLNKDPNQPIQLLVVQSEAGLSPLSITTIVAYAMLALHSIIFEEVYTLYAVTPLSSHGLGWNAMQLSTSLAAMGAIQLFMQFVAYPKLERIFSAVSLFRFSQLMYACVYLLFPLIRAFAVDEDDAETGGQIPRVRYLVLTGLVFKYLCSVFSYTSVMVMITNSSPPHLLGTVNGIGQTSASFMRAFGPALGGILWAWSLSNKLNFPFNYFFVFFLMGTIAILCFVHSLSIPHDLGLKRI